MGTSKQGTKWSSSTLCAVNHCVPQSLGRLVVRPICFSSLNDIRRASAKCHGTKKRRRRGGLTDDDAGPGRTGWLACARRREETSLWRLVSHLTTGRAAAIRNDVEKRLNRRGEEKEGCGLGDGGVNNGERTAASLGIVSREYNGVGTLILI